MQWVHYCYYSTDSTQTRMNLKMSDFNAAIKASGFDTIALKFFGNAAVDFAGHL